MINILVFLEVLGKNILVFLEVLSKNILVFLEVLSKNILVFLDILGKNILVNVIKALFLHPLQHQNNDYGTDIQTQTIRQTS
jgi:hypothetical protein